MKIIDLFNSKKPVLSFEVFPPKADSPLDDIFKALDKFAKLRPDFMSVTYGAGGNGNKRTVEISSRIKNTLGIESLTHLTCIGHTKDEIDAILSNMSKNNLENILALRGDLPVGEKRLPDGKRDFSYASDLIDHIKKHKKSGIFSTAAAAYIEGHVECKSLKQDLLNLKYKYDRGVDFLITQLFFDNRRYFEFIEKAAGIGVACPIVPGIMPVFKADQIKTISAKSGCSIPADLVLMMDKYGSEPEEMKKAGIDYAARQIRDLLEGGAPGLHIYTMVRPVSTKLILEQAGIR
ncbi:MAG: methylenetetrahydrofolate reductase [Eubacteriales bacterium]|nr:methylenetetrahydrofolate reductase [Eubacteriales bacterium]